MIKIHNTDYDIALREAFLKAKKSIYITSYVTVLNRRKKNCPTNKLFSILLSKLNSGLDIRWIVDHPRKHKNNFHATKYIIRRLKENCIPFWIAPKQNTLHCKLVIIDDHKFFLGSHNLTKSSFINPLEITLEIDDINPCKSLTAWFLAQCHDPRFLFFPPANYEISNIYP